MLWWAVVTVSGMVAPTPPDLTLRRATLVSLLDRTKRELAELDASLSPLSCDIEDVMAPRGYLTKTAGCYLTDGAMGPPPSALTLALSNFGRELKELVATVIPYQTTGASKTWGEGSEIYASALQRLTLDNDVVWAREEALVDTAVPAPLLIKLPYLAICNVLDKIYDGTDGRRVLAKFWYLEVSPLRLELGALLSCCLTPVCIPPWTDSGPCPVLRLQYDDLPVRDDGMVAPFLRAQEGPLQGR